MRCIFLFFEGDSELETAATSLSLLEGASRKLAKWFWPSLFPLARPELTGNGVCGTAPSPDAKPWFPIGFQWIALFPSAGIAELTSPPLSFCWGRLDFEFDLFSDSDIKLLGSGVFEVFNVDYRLYIRSFCKLCKLSRFKVALLIIAVSIFFAFSFICSFSLICKCTMMKSDW